VDGDDLENCRDDPTAGLNPTAEASSYTTYSHRGEQAKYREQPAEYRGPTSKTSRPTNSRSTRTIKDIQENTDRFYKLGEYM